MDWGLNRNLSNYSHWLFNGLVSSFLSACSPITTYQHTCDIYHRNPYREWFLHKHHPSSPEYDGIVNGEVISGQSANVPVSNADRVTKDVKETEVGWTWDADPVAGLQPKRNGFLMVCCSNQYSVIVVLRYLQYNGSVFSFKHVLLKYACHLEETYNIIYNIVVM